MFDFGLNSQLLQSFVLFLLDLVYSFVDWDLAELVLVHHPLTSVRLETAFFHELHLLLALEFLPILASTIRFVHESVLEWKLDV